MTLKEMSSLKGWHQYFTENARAADGIPWDLVEMLTKEEVACISDSIATFQLGEYAEGRGLMRYAEDYAKKFGDDRLTKITRLFICEEQNHALLLRRFMQVHKIKLIESNWTDTVFRRLRKNVGYEWSITVLIVAEIIALVYYKALRDATHSTVLKKICNKILSDEAFHVAYESELIRNIRNSNPSILKITAIIFHRFLFSGTVIVVYFSHRSVLNRGGYRFFDFWRSCLKEFDTLFKSHKSIQLSVWNQR